MPAMIQARTPDEIKRLGIAAVREAYNKLAKDYNKIVDREYLICPICGNVKKTETNYYVDRKYVAGKYPVCKECLQMIAENRKNPGDKANETQESVLRVLRMLDCPYKHDLYMKCRKDCADSTKEKAWASPFMQYISVVKSLPQMSTLTYEDSDFEKEEEDVSSDVNENSKLIKDARKHFGKKYSLDDLVFLENTYKEWTTFYSCETKAQEVLFKRICCTLLKINEAEQGGRDTKELDKTLQELMGSSQVKPNQNNSNTLTESKTFGQLIAKWEIEKPVDEPEEEFKDVDRMGLWVDVFFKGHLAKMMNFKNAFSILYDKFITKYTVKKPTVDEESESEEIFNKLFGELDDE